MTSSYVAPIAFGVRPRYGALLVTAWLAGIIVDLLLIPGHDEVALRDVGLMVSAFALSGLAVAEDHVRHGATS